MLVGFELDKFWAQGNDSSVVVVTTSTSKRVGRSIL